MTPSEHDAVRQLTQGLFFDPKVLADLGMKRAAQSAERMNPGWTDEAFEFLKKYARSHELFISEDVSDMSREEGMRQPSTDRAWGSIYTRAQKENIIIQDGSGRSRRRHNSICPRWRSLIFAGSSSTD